MLRTMIVAASCLCLVSSGIAGEESKKTAASPAAQHQTLVEQYEQGGLSREFSGKFLKLARQHPRDPVAVDALLWVVTHVRSGAELSLALETLTKNYIKSKKLESVCRRLVRKPSVAAEKLLRSLMEKSPHRNVRAQACFQFADYLKRQVAMIGTLKEDPRQAKRFDQYYGKGFSKHLVSLDEAELSKEIEKLYVRVVKSFADVPLGESTMGKTAETELFAIRHLSLGRKSPGIEGTDIDGNPLKLSGYRGKVIVLDFWGNW
jgi:hypothetical protein